MSERQESGKTYVYRAFDARGQLLYVGMTGNLVKRMMNHQSRHWIWDVESLTAETYPTRREARLAEIQAIRTEASPMELHAHRGQGSGQRQVLGVGAEAVHARVAVAHQ